MANNDNFMGHWGKSNWDTALKYNGAISIGNAKKYVLENILNWNNLEEEERQYMKSITCLMLEQKIEKKLLN